MGFNSGFKGLNCAEGIFDKDDLKREYSDKPFNDERQDCFI